ncbi:MAG: hypothetical protein AVDCRST_MAG89-1069, partial [uncultured Gemmatimonadetes bacterium]
DRTTLDRASQDDGLPARGAARG